MRRRAAMLRRVVPVAAAVWRARPRLLVRHEPRGRIKLARQLSEAFQVGVPVHLVDEQDRMRVAGLWDEAEHVARHELGIRARDLNDARIAVIDGGEADEENATTHMGDLTGLTTFDKNLMTRADAVGTAAAASHNRDELMQHLRALADGTFVRPDALDATQERRQQDAALFLPEAHELAHNIGLVVRRRQASPKSARASSRAAESSFAALFKAAAAPQEDGETGDARRQRAFGLELAADHVAHEMLLRAGKSPLGAASMRLYFAFRHAVRDGADFAAGSTADHPTDFHRYVAMYQDLAERRDAQRQIDRGLAPRTDGAAYMTDEMKREFDVLPTPDEARAALLQYLHEMRGY
jgi:hypothetical protein